MFLYAESGAGRRPAFFRRGGPEELQRRVDAGELAPDFGPARLDPGAGAVLVEARSPLVAFNVALASSDVEVARAVAAIVRESSGGLPGVQALGLLLERTGRAQVSMNILDVETTPLHEVVARVRSEAAAWGVEVAGGGSSDCSRDRWWRPRQRLRWRSTVFVPIGCSSCASSRRATRLAPSVGAGVRAAAEPARRRHELVTPASRARR